MSWSITVSGHEPEDSEVENGTIRSAAIDLLDELQRAGAHVTYAYVALPGTAEDPTGGSGSLLDA